MTFEELRAANIQRCEEVFHPLREWSLCDWATAATGELGEACNIIKKMKRGATSYNNPQKNLSEENVEHRAMLAEELADCVIYLDLLAARARIDLSQAIRKKFNKVSAENNSVIYL